MTLFEVFISIFAVAVLALWIVPIVLIATGKMRYRGGGYPSSYDRG